MIEMIMFLLSLKKSLQQTFVSLKDVITKKVFSEQNNNFIETLKKSKIQ